MRVEHGDLMCCCDKEDCDGAARFACIAKMISDFNRAADSVRSRECQEKSKEEVLLQRLWGTRCQIGWILWAMCVHMCVYASAISCLQID